MNDPIVELVSKSRRAMFLSVIAFLSEAVPVKAITFSESVVRPKYLAMAEYFAIGPAPVPNATNKKMEANGRTSYVGFLVFSAHQTASLSGTYI